MQLYLLALLFQMNDQLFLLFNQFLYYDISVMDKGLVYADQVKVDNNDDKINDVEKYGKEIAMYLFT